MAARDGEAVFPVCFRFEGWQLRRQGADGPFRLADIVVTPGGAEANPGNADPVSLQGEYLTAAYPPSSFSVKRKPLVLTAQYDGVLIGVPGAPDAEGWRTVEVAFTMPTEEQLEQYRLHGWPRWEEFCCWQLRTEVAVCTTSARCELEHAAPWPWQPGIAAGVDLSAQTGAGEHWLPGETKRFQVRFRMDLAEGELPPLVLGLFLDREKDAPAMSGSEGIFPELDANQDGALDAAEVAAGWEAWKRDECMPLVFLEAITLGKYAEYRYDNAAGRFVGVRHSP